MSDEDQPVPFHMMRFGPSPEEIEQARMEASVNGHENLDFLTDLDADQLRKLQGILHTCVHSDGLATQYFIGLISGILTLKHKICLVCGIDHDEALGSMSGQGHEKSKPVGAYSNYEEFMIQYDMEKDEGGSENVACINCGKWYPTLADRMLRPAGKSGCSGCIEKEKWG